MTEQEKKVEALRNEFWGIAYEYDEGQRHDHSCDSPRMDELAEEMSSIRRELDEMGEGVGECPWEDDEDSDDY